MPKDKAVAVVIHPDGTAYTADMFAGVCTKYLADCTAAHVPPHGDLIDRAELWVEINKICDRRDAGIITDLTCLQQILSALRHASTIIQAEEGK